MTTTAVKERPILFKGRLVRAILENRKTHTRRVMNPQPVFSEDGGAWYPSVPISLEGRIGRAKHYAREEHFRKGAPVEFSPYGQPGDRLWVRESFSVPWKHGLNEGPLPCHYWADGNPEHGDWTRPKPSIHMPRWASRLTLEIVRVRVERIQDISEADAKAEGVQIPVDVQGCPPGKGHPMVDVCAPYLRTHGPGFKDAYFRAQFSVLWDEVNKARGFGWEANPWVWVVEFRRAQA